MSGEEILAFTHPSEFFLEIKFHRISVDRERGTSPTPCWQSHQSGLSVAGQLAGAGVVEPTSGFLSS